jgi:nucleotide-binding universal stress UspA family protein
VRFNRVVIGMDFGAPAIRAAKWVADFLAPDAEIHLVHVIDPPVGREAYTIVDGEPVAVEDIVREFAEGQMRQITPFLTDTIATVEICVGRPSDVIVNVARERQADLIAIGPHGGRRPASRFLGTAAEQIVRLSRVPVLVGTGPRRAAPRRLLVPVDDSVVTSTLLATAADLGERFDARVTAMHVWSNAEYSHVASMALATSAHESDARVEIDNDLRSARAHWLEATLHAGVPLNRATAVVACGSAGDAVVEFANTHAIDLIIMGKRGSGLVAPALLGSTISTVLRGAECPVLVMNDPPD